MDQPAPACVISQAIAVPAPVVYDFARRMENLPAWASGLAAGIEKRDGHWFAASPMGEVRVDMAPHNPFGVLDHEVTLPGGQRVHNALRVTPCGEGASLLCFVLLRQAGVAQADFDADIAQVRQDLAALRQLLERQPPS
ncbi:MAG TPA: SRPBCC family protein [Pseudorhodoferax sp.]|nr:SRPBCC family protein [Pseudorhodoferax sp.]